MKHISVQSFQEVIDAERNNPSVDFINVCTPAEYAEQHIRGVRNVPLADLKNRANEFADKKTLYVHCRSGRRGQEALKQLKALGITAELVNVEGGLLAWTEAGFTTGSHTSRLPIMRQVLIAAGAFILLGFVLTESVHASFAYLGVFVGAGLLFAGVTGWCGMSYALARMPWNR